MKTEQKNTAVFHPLKYILALKKICLDHSIQIYEHTMVTELKKESDHYIVKANGHQIKAKQVVFACHYPSFIIPGWIPFKTYLEKSYLSATQTKEHFAFSAINLDTDTYSFREHKNKKENYFIYLSEKHKLNNDIDPVKHFHQLSQKVEELFQKKPDFLWSNYDLMTNDHLPLIGRLKQDDPNLLIATGFQTWGMTNGILSGKILSDLILEKDNPYIKLFQPDRNLNLTKIGNDVINDLNMGKAFCQTKIKKNYDFYPDNVKVITKDGKRYGIYMDENNKEHIVSNLCPHMKCSLFFNPTTKSWDCPCHGSRFDIDGNVLKGPSTYSIKID